MKHKSRLLNDACAALGCDVFVCERTVATAASAALPALLVSDARENAQAGGRIRVHALIRRARRLVRSVPQLFDVDEFGVARLRAFFLQRWRRAEYVFPRRGVLRCAWIAWKCFDCRDERRRVVVRDACENGRAVGHTRRRPRKVAVPVDGVHTPIPHCAQRGELCKVTSNGVCAFSAENGPRIAQVARRIEAAASHHNDVRIGVSHIVPRNLLRLSGRAHVVARKSGLAIRGGDHLRHPMPGVIWRVEPFQHRDSRPAL
mmetsp:Transcript_15286/g.41091  ORF Transcript_15286/g.41091 Transcript_15286/m.41091 type:complete len:260 (+) Transcript_15286:1555-2334(+)